MHRLPEDCDLFLDLVRGMLAYNPAERPTAVDAAAHAWFAAAPEPESISAYL